MSAAARWRQLGAGRARACGVGAALPSIYERGGGAALREGSLKPLPNPSWKDSFLLPLGNHCSSLTFQTSRLTFNFEL